MRTISICFLLFILSKAQVNSKKKRTYLFILSEKFLYSRISATIMGNNS